MAFIKLPELGEWVNVFIISRVSVAPLRKTNKKPHHKHVLILSTFNQAGTGPAPLFEQVFPTKAAAEAARDRIGASVARYFDPEGDAAMAFHETENMTAH